MSNVLYFSCTHAPFMQEGFPDFLNDLRKEHKCTIGAHLGDAMDRHTLSRWAKSPHAMGTIEEHKKGIKQLKDIWKIFKKGYLATSNHDDRPYLRASEVGVPDSFLKAHSEILELPKGWQVQKLVNIDGVNGKHHHAGGQKSLENACLKRYHSHVMLGHQHTLLRVQTFATELATYTGVNVGCGVNVTDDSYAFEYNKDQDSRPVVGAAVCVDGKYFYTEAMDLGTKIKRK